MHDTTTIDLLPDRPVAAHPVIDGALNTPTVATSILGSRERSADGHLLSRHKTIIGVGAVTVIALALVLLAYHYLSHKNATVIHSLAVLPFINVNADPRFDYLSDGMTEMLIRDLSRLPTLNVKARSSVFHYKNKDVSPHTVGTELNAQAILNGRIVLRGELLSLSVELADAQTDNIIWSEQFTRKQTDLVSLQNEVTLDVFNKLPESSQPGRAEVSEEVLY